MPIGAVAGREDAMKTSLREKIMKLRQDLGPEASHRYSMQIARRLFDTELYKKSHSIMAYMSFRSEVDTGHIIRYSLNSGKRIIIPITQKETRTLLLSEIRDPDSELVPGSYGILEPLPGHMKPYAKEDLDLILVPALAYDPRGFRLGYGAGYYDRFLSALKKPVPTIGLAFEIQVLTEVPTEATDIPVDYIVTENRIINCLDIRGHSS
ncbi:MAG: 5-formyltetrahydrofolate cyclo-ligase [Firmicutes bacterium]|nr:5-formyltetrahydrofolate cyclo-ligase [Bacillota bacterium]MDI6704879.1 5-formyltetrahydrofolate cyclo-ligase [Bacillota bacterium]